MGTLDKNTVVVGASVVIGLVLAGMAGVTYSARASTIDALSEQQLHLNMLQEQLASARSQPRPAPAPVPLQRRWQLGDGPEIVATMQAVQTLGDAVGVTFEGLKAMRSADNGKQSFSLSGYGTPSEVCAFVAAVEQDDRLMVVETGRLFAGGDDQVAFEIGLATYHQGGQ